MEALSCPICGDTFEHNEYIVHMVEIHNGKFHVCENYIKCGKAYKTSAALRIHVKNQHPPKTESSTQTMASFNNGCWTCVRCGGTEEFTSSNDKTEPIVEHVCVLAASNAERGLYGFLKEIQRIILVCCLGEQENDLNCGEAMSNSSKSVLILKKFFIDFDFIGENCLSVEENECEEVYDSGRAKIIIVSGCYL